MGEDGVVQAAGIWDSFAAIGETLAEEAISDIGCGGMIERVESGVADIFLQEAAAFFNDDHLITKFAEFGDDLRIGGIAHAHGEDGELPGQAKISQNMLQVRGGHAGDDEANRSSICDVRFSILDPIDAEPSCGLDRRCKSFGDFHLMLPRPRGQEHLVEIHFGCFQLEFFSRVELWILIGIARDGAAPVRCGGADDVTDVTARNLRELEAQGDPVLQLLNIARFDGRHAKMLTDEPRIGRDLRRIAPGVLPHDDHRAALFVSPCKISQGQRVGRDVHADVFHSGHSAKWHHLRAINRRSGEGLVVRLKGADSLLLEKVFDVAHGVEETAYG